VGLKDWMRRVERAARGEIEGFELLDGSRYYFDSEEAYKALFLHWCDCLHAGSAHNWPEPPELLRKITDAKDPERALGALGVVNQGSSFLVYDLEILVSERRLEPRGLVTRYDPETGEHHIRDPYEDFCEDLSE